MQKELWNPGCTPHPDPGAYRCGHRAPEWEEPGFAAFAAHLERQVWGLERDIIQAQGNQLRPTQSSCYTHRQHGASTHGATGGGWWVVEDRLALRGTQGVKQPLGSLLLGDGEHTVDLLKGAGDAMGNNMHKRLDGGQPCVARPRRIASYPLPGLQECEDPGSVQVCKV
jgi:hypothetical protein